MAGSLSEADLLSQLDHLARAVRTAAPGVPAGPAAPMSKAEPALAAPPSPTSAEDHRARLRARLLTAGPDALADHELLEAVLFLGSCAATPSPSPTA